MICILFLAHGPYFTPRAGRSFEALSNPQAVEGSSKLFVFQRQDSGSPAWAVGERSRAEGAFYSGMETEVHADRP